MWYPFRKKKRNGYTTFDWERLEERRPGEMQTEGGRLGEKKLFSKKGRDPLQKGEENIEIEVILFIL